MTSSSTHRLSDLERAMTRLAETVASIAEDDKLRRIEDARTRKERKEEERTRREESERERKERKEEQRAWNLKWGETANKMGTLVEDIVAPSIPRVVGELFGLPGSDPLDAFAIRVRRHANEERYEFDAVAAWPGYFLINETKTQLRPGDIPRFVKTLRRSRRFFPEYQDSKLVGALASLYLDPSLIRHVERQGIIVMGLGDHLMESKNLPGFRPAEF